ncbi:MAG: hypothetical protein AAFZ07_09290 [Actinomycetota bacterium]
MKRFRLPPSLGLEPGARPPVRAVQRGLDQAGLEYDVVATAPTHMTLIDRRDGRRLRATVTWGSPWCRISRLRPT